MSTGERSGGEYGFSGCVQFVSCFVVHIRSPVGLKYKLALRVCTAPIHFSLLLFTFQKSQRYFSER